MKYILFLALIFLVSCSFPTNQPDTNRIQSLEKEIQDLKLENAHLKSENQLLSAGGTPGMIQSTSGSPGMIEAGNPLFPEGGTFVESNGAECMKKAHDDYIAAGIKKCKSIGYSDIDIRANKCQLDTTFIQSLEKERTNIEATCAPQ